MLTVRVTRGLALAGLCSVLLLACATGGAPLVTETYVVAPHDTLYGIAWRHDLDYRDLARWNNIGSDYRLSVGQVLNLRPPGGVAERTARAAAIASHPRPASLPSLPSTPSTPSSTSRPSPTAAEPPVTRVTRAPLDAAAVQAHWVWPTDQKSAPRPVPGGGILLLGELGQDIRAASAGRVVYTGSGLRGYGNLIIIKHGDTLLSSYAHNRELLVHEGEDVSAGQLIAHMGVGPHQVSALYFEIRVNGKPIDPAPYLPAVK